MKVKMLTRAADANRAMKPGHIYDLEDQEAKMLVDGGYAEDVSESVVELKTSLLELTPLEIADSLPPVEMSESLEGSELRKSKANSKTKAQKGA